MHITRCIVITFYCLDNARMLSTHNVSNLSKEIKMAQLQNHFDAFLMWVQYDT